MSNLANASTTSTILLNSPQDVMKFLSNAIAEVMPFVSCRRYDVFYRLSIFYLLTIMPPIGINVYAIRSVLLTCSLDHIFDLDFFCIFKKLEEDVILEVVEYFPGCCCHIKEIKSMNATLFKN